MTKKRFRELLGIEKMKKRNGELYASYKYIFDNFKELMPGKNYYKWYTGSGRRIKISSKFDESSLELLKKFCNFSLGNDAPRGGASGDYIEIAPKEYKKLQKRLSYIEDDLNFVYVSKAQKERDRKKQDMIISFLQEYPEAKRYRDILEKTDYCFLESKISNIKKILSIKRNGIELIKKWANAGQHHPAPPEVVALKKASGMTWSEFLLSLGIEKRH